MRGLPHTFPTSTVCFLAISIVMSVPQLLQGAEPASAPPPVFSHPTGIYGDSITIQLSVDLAEATIHFTVDGAQPTEASPAYTVPITISASTRVLAKSFAPRVEASQTVRALYVLLDDELGEFDSDLGLVVIDTFGRPLSSSFGMAAFVAAFAADEGERPSLSSTPDFVGGGRIMMVSDEGLGFPKKDYALALVSDDGQPLVASVLGLPAESDWRLNGPYSDKSLMREMLSYALGNDIGRYAPRTRPFELFLHTGSGKVTQSHYQGLYILMETIKRGADRVDIAELQPTHNETPEITGGYIVAIDRLEPWESGFLTEGGMTLRFVEPVEREITIAQAAYIKGYFDDFEYALFGAGFQDPVEGYTRYIDVDSFVDHHILVETMRNIEGFRLNTYIHKNRGGKLTMGPIWDYKLTFGNANYLNGWSPEGWYMADVNTGAATWYQRLFQDPAFEARYWRRWQALREGPFAMERLLSLVDATAGQLGEAQERNFQKWPVLGTYVWPNWFVADTYAAEIGFVKDWVTARLEWIDSQSTLPRFFRGDANASGKIDIADAICTLAYLFGAPSDPCKQSVYDCQDAADANDDGTIDIADAVKILAHLFAAAGPLPAPFDECGVDPTDDRLDCENYPPWR